VSLRPPLSARTLAGSHEARENFPKARSVYAGMRLACCALALLAAVGGCATAPALTSPVAGKTVLSKVSYDLFANTSVMLVSSKGTVVLMDAFMTLPGIKPDLVTVSHFHGDHFDPYLLGFVRCARSTALVERFTYKDVEVEGLASTHGGEPIDPRWPTNVIYILTVDGIRIAHLGDFGQRELTEVQRRQLAGVDILIAPCTYLLVPEKASVALIEEIDPRIVLPTHCTRAGLKLLKAMANDVIVRDDRIAIGRADLIPGRTRLVLLERSDDVFLVSRFLIMELPSYPITKFMLALLLALATVYWVLRRVFLRRSSDELLLAERKGN